MGNSEVGHLNLGAGAIVPQDLARIDAAVEDGSLAENEVAAGRVRGRAARAPDRARVRRRRALLRPPPEGADRARRRVGRARRRRPRVHRRPRHLAHGRREVPRRGRGAGATGARVGSVVGRYFAMDRDKRWDRDPEGLRPARARQGRAPRRQRRAGGDRPPTSATRPTSSSPPTTVGEEARIRPGDAVLALQLPPRPHARDHARAGRPGLRRDRPRRRRARSSATRR